MLVTIEFSMLTANLKKAYKTYKNYKYYRAIRHTLTGGAVLLFFSVKYA